NTSISAPLLSELTMGGKVNSTVNILKSCALNKLNSRYWQ
ncbi:MAG: hypothetical protein ACI9YH_003180, partial [Colwellia sp.]